MANIKQLYEDNNKTVEAYLRVWLPVGSLYWNENDISADISKYFVGTWVRVKDVFILAAGDTYTAKTSGGEATHKLTIEEMPEHGHNMYPRNGLDGRAGGYGTGASDNYGYSVENSSNNYGSVYSGGSQSHNNMPPYYVAYCWKRIS